MEVADSIVHPRLPRHLLTHGSRLLLHFGSLKRRKSGHNVLPPQSGDRHRAGPDTQLAAQLPPEQLISTKRNLHMHAYRSLAKSAGKDWRDGAVVLME